MGLNHPRDLNAWRAWQARQVSAPVRAAGLARSALASVRRATSRTVTLTTTSPTPRTIVCMESRSPTTALALLAPLRHLPLEHVAVLSPGPILDLLPEAPWIETTAELHDLALRLVSNDSVVLSTGNYLPIGGVVHEATQREDRFVTVQHGLLTPHAPPLARGTTLLAFSDADADFWRAGRVDVTTGTVGSQLLWDASRADPTPTDPTLPPVFLGQLHGAELPRRAMARSAEDFCIANHAAYRPHPSETDRLSRRTHARFEHDGIEIDRTGQPLPGLGRPVVSAFSTGVLEAAARGLPAWVHFDDRPAWLGEFWDRYGLAPWGGAPTAPPRQPQVEPARAVAEHVLALLREAS